MQLLASYAQHTHAVNTHNTQHAARSTQHAAPPTMLSGVVVYIFLSIHRSATDAALVSAMMRREYLLKTMIRRKPV